MRGFIAVTLLGHNKLPSAAQIGGQSTPATVRCMAWFGVIGGNALDSPVVFPILHDYGACLPQPCGLKTRSTEAGNFANFSAGRRGRATSSPPQLGH
jgi:hypothetical protein